MIKIFCAASFFLLSCFCIAQGRYPGICITQNKTTALVFPSTILHVDRGTGAVLVQKV